MKPKELLPGMVSTVRMGWKHLPAARSDSAFSIRSMHTGMVSFSRASFSSMIIIIYASFVLSRTSLPAWKT